jgi:hypothetical protein
LKATPEKSNRQIAETAKVDHKTVASVRAEKQATGEIPQLTKTTGKDGKQRKSPTKTFEEVTVTDTITGKKMKLKPGEKAAPITPCGTALGPTTIIGEQAHKPKQPSTEQLKQQAKSIADKYIEPATPAAQQAEQAAEPAISFQQGLRDKTAKEIAEAIVAIDIDKALDLVEAINTAIIEKRKAAAMLADEDAYGVPKFLSRHPD